MKYVHRYTNENNMNLDYAGYVPSGIKGFVAGGITFKYFYYNGDRGWAHWDSEQYLNPEDDEHHIMAYCDEDIPVVNDTVDVYDYYSGDEYEATITEIISDSGETIEDEYTEPWLSASDGNSKPYYNRSTAEYVDLGLPSGNLWAACNIGATSPEQMGLFFAYGETEPKSYYSWDTYKFYDGNPGNVTKYNQYDNKHKLDYTDDAARKYCKNEWKTPSVNDVLELDEYTTKELVFVNNVLCTEFTSVVPGNENKLYIPWVSSIFEDEIDNNGSYLRLMTSDNPKIIDNSGNFDYTFYGNYEEYYLYAYTAGSCGHMNYLMCAVHSEGHYRYMGCQVRPVTKNKKGKAPYKGTIITTPYER